MTSKKELTTRTAHYTLRDDNIVLQVVQGGLHQTLADADENIAAFRSIASPAKLPLLVDMRASFTTDNDARDRYAGDEAARWCSAMAMLVKSTASRMIGNFFLAMSRPKFPCRMFTDEAEAIGWLKAQRI